MKKLSAIAVTGLLSVVAAGCASSNHKNHPASSASAIPLNHFYQVDPHLYRGAQPTPEGFRRLADMGVKTIVNLRAQGKMRRAEERKLVESLGMRWVSLPMRSYWRPNDTQVQAFLELVADSSRQPVFIHCQKGEDRTGSLVAAYRIAQQGWTPERAYAEALTLGLAAWNPFMRSLILYDILRPGAVRTASAPQ
ncbi:MAG: tyrosine-protein phosphatase [Candidatus Omnitrophica bacterium]|nr:tyrosine-protein phosphatase [Candidatus Omnitrophota bacterium]